MIAQKLFRILGLPIFFALITIVVTFRGYHILQFSIVKDYLSLTYFFDLIPDNLYLNLIKTIMLCKKSSYFTIIIYDILVKTIIITLIMTLQLKIYALLQFSFYKIINLKTDKTPI